MKTSSSRAVQQGLSISCRNFHFPFLIAVYFTTFLPIILFSLSSIEFSTLFLSSSCSSANIFLYGTFRTSFKDKHSCLLIHITGLKYLFQDVQSPFYDLSEVVCRNRNLNITSVRVLLQICSEWPSECEVFPAMHTPASSLVTKDFS